MEVAVGWWSLVFVLLLQLAHPTPHFVCPPFTRTASLEAIDQQPNIPKFPPPPFHFNIINTSVPIVNPTSTYRDHTDSIRPLIYTQQAQIT